MVHDAKATMEFASRLQQLSAELADELLVVMHVNFEDSSIVPTGGWKGFVNDPMLDGSLQVRAPRLLPPSHEGPHLPPPRPKQPPTPTRAPAIPILHPP